MPRANDPRPAQMRIVKTRARWRRSDADGERALKAAIYTPRALRDPARRTPRGRLDARDNTWQDGPPDLPGAGWPASVKVLCVAAVLWGLYRAAPWVGAWVLAHWR